MGWDSWWYFPQNAAYNLRSSVTLKKLTDDEREKGV